MPSIRKLESPGSGPHSALRRPISGATPQGAGGSGKDGDVSTGANEVSEARSEPPDPSRRGLASTDVLSALYLNGDSGGVVTYLSASGLLPSARPGWGIGILQPCGGWEADSISAPGPGSFCTRHRRPTATAAPAVASVSRAGTAGSRPSSVPVPVEAPTARDAPRDATTLIQRPIASKTPNTPAHPTIITD